MTTSSTTISFKEVETVKQVLHNTLNEALKPLLTFQHCVLLNYPNHYNIGDHLIWLGTIFYLTDVLKSDLKYAASIENFSNAQMDEKAGQSPIFFHGGGNLGDLWSYYQNFYEKIILQYRDRPIIFLPQSIFFRHENRLNKAKEIFNDHPDLTIITREDRSNSFAREHFYNCKIFKAPDMALQAIGIPKMSLPPKQKDTILYLCRQDGELNRESSPDSIDLPNLIVEDWASYKYQGTPRLLSVRGMTRLLARGWQEETGIPLEWISRQIWQQFHPYSSKFNGMYDPALHRKSWNFMHNGAFQFQQHRLVITNRLHGHMLCIILGIPHVFLTNAYHKNESFYNTWTYKIPFCRFVKQASQIKPAAQELLALYR
jgi:pyruvyl transferase EpsO